MIILNGLYCSKIEKKNLMLEMANILKAGAHFK